MQSSSWILTVFWSPSQALHRPEQFLTFGNTYPHLGSTLAQPRCHQATIDHFTFRTVDKVLRSPPALIRGLASNGKRWDIWRARRKKMEVISLPSEGGMICKPGNIRSRPSWYISMSMEQTISHGGSAVRLNISYINSRKTHMYKSCSASPDYDVEPFLYKLVSCSKLYFYNRSPIIMWPSLQVLGTSIGQWWPDNRQIAARQC